MKRAEINAIHWLADQHTVEGGQIGCHIVISPNAGPNLPVNYQTDHLITRRVVIEQEQPILVDGLSKRVTYAAVPKMKPQSAMLGSVQQRAIRRPEHAERSGLGETEQ